MNLWQKIFLTLGIVSALVICVFPPQLISSRSVKFMPITYGYPIDWFRLFLWLVAIVFVASLGIMANKGEHL